MSRHKHAYDEKYLHNEDQAWELIQERPEQFYVYVLINPLNNLPFYVGKGQGNRCFTHWYNRHKRDNFKNSFLISLGLKPIFVFELFTQDESQAYEFEAELINKFGQKIHNSSNLLYNIETSSNKRAISYKASKFINDARKIHGDKYDYSKSVYKSTQEDIEIICKEHGPFWQRPLNHCKRGDGCPKCAGNKRLNLEYVISNLSLIHNNYYNYSKILEYHNNSQPLPILCPKHGLFNQSYWVHQKGVGCPKCGIELISLKKKKKVSKISVVNGSVIFIYESYEVAANDLKISRQTVRRRIQSGYIFENNFILKDCNDS